MYVDPSGEFIQWILAGAIILGKTYYDGYKAINKEINPTKCNWNNASYSIGVGGSSDGISSYYINVGIGWDTGFTPVIGFSKYGFGFGFHNFAGNFFVGYPGHNYDKAAEAAYEAISRTDWGIDYLQHRRDYMRSGSLSNIHPEFDILLLGQWSATNRVIGQVENAAKTGTNVVYQGLDAAGTVRYVGITERAAATRFAEHINSGTARSLLDYRVVDGATGLSRTGARVWEQTLINQYGLGKNGGLLLNKVNSIAPKYWWQYGINP